MAEANMNISVLLVKYLKNELTSQEWQVLEQWRQASEQNQALFDSITNEEQLTAEMTQVLAIDRDAARKKALALEFPETTLPSTTRWWRYMAAAAVLLILMISAYFIITTRKKTSAVTHHLSPVNNDITPGGNKAVLTLSDNTTIVLDNAQNGLLTKQGGAVVNKKEGVLEYGKSAGDARKANTLFNTLSTPKGGQYQLVLPDGTKVWLNAASSIKYPVQFNDNERSVAITGEAYLEVAKDAARPFKVNGQNMQVEVLGTHFNINSYRDEPVIQTTLLEGKVKIITPGSTALLKPGQAARIGHAGGISIDQEPNLQAIVAWKNGSFYFDHASIETIMRQVARWYDVEVTYQDKIQQQFNGEIPRQVNVAELFEMLESTGWVHFKINGRKIIVMQ